MELERETVVVRAILVAESLVVDREERGALECRESSCRLNEHEIVRNGNVHAGSIAVPLREALWARDELLFSGRTRGRISRSRLLGIGVVDRFVVWSEI